MNLGEVKLRKTETRDKSGLVKDTWDPEFLAKYQNSVLDINIESWVDVLGDDTFPTRFVELPLDEAKFLTELYEATMERKEELTPEQTTRLRLLEERLEPVIREVRGAEPYVFVKTSSRSPKDAPIGHETMRTLYRQNLARIEGEHDVNAKVIAMLQTGVELMKVSNAQEAVWLIRTSERIYQDMMMALKYPERFHENYVIRKWVDLSVDMEFRTFVHGGRMVAISQYNHMNYFARLEAKMPQLEQAMLDAFNNRIKGKLDGKFENYILDFGITEEGRVWVIELNPFAETTDAAMFHWTHDAEVLHGRAPYECRFRKTKAAGVRALISEKWRELVDSE